MGLASLGRRGEDFGYGDERYWPPSKERMAAEPNRTFWSPDEQARQRAAAQDLRARVAAAFATRRDDIKPVPKGVWRDE